MEKIFNKLDDRSRAKYRLTCIQKDLSTLIAGTASCLTVALCLSGLFVATGSHAGNFLYDANGFLCSEEFSDGQCWSPAGAPGSSDSTSFLNQGVVGNRKELDFTVDAFGVDSIMRRSHMNWNLNGHTYTLFGTSPIINDIYDKGSLILSDQSASDSQLLIRNGSMQTEYVRQSVFDGSASTLAIQNVTWNNTWDIDLGIGIGSIANLNVSNSHVISHTMSIADADDSTAIANIAAGSDLDLVALTVGRYGDGQLVVRQNSNITTTSGILIGHGSSTDPTLNGSGQIEVIANGDTAHFGTDGLLRVGTYGDASLLVQGTGATVSADDLTLAASGGSGELNILNGGVVTIFDDATFAAFGSSSTPVATVNVDGTGSRLDVASYLEVSRDGVAEMNITNGAVVTADGGGSLASLTDSIGSILVDGEHSTLLIDDLFYVASGGAGEFDVRNGARVESKDISAGGFRGSATITLESLVPATSEFIIDGSLYLAGYSTGPSQYGGTASVELFDNSLMSVSGTTQLYSGGQLLIDGGQLQTSSFDSTDGSFAFRHGVLDIDGGTAGFGTDITLGSQPGAPFGYTSSKIAEMNLKNGVIANTGTLRVGAFNSASLSITGGSQLSSTTALIGTGFTAGLLPTTTVLVEGAGSRWYIANDLVIGQHKPAQVSVLNGATLTSGDASIENSSDVLVDGAGSNWTVNGNLDIGGAPSTLATTYGDLVVSNGATVNVSGITDINPNGSLIIDGADYITGSMDNTVGGTLDLRDGQLIIDGGQFKPGSGFELDGATAADLPVLVLRNGVTENLANLSQEYIGRQHQGQAFVESGSQRNTYYSTVGNDAGSHGLVRVTGSDQLGNGSAWSAFQITLGERGTGRLEVLDGAAVDTTWMILGAQSGSRGELLISGANSSVTADRFDFVGWRGEGSLHVDDYAYLDTTSTTSTFIAQLSGSQGEVRVSNHGRWDAQNVYLGFQSNSAGTLNIDSGGVVTSQFNTWVGHRTSGAGHINVDGAGSKLLVNNSLYLGAGGKGFMNITNGARVVNEDTAFVGYQVGGDAEGHVLVSGAGSRWVMHGHQILSGYAGAAKARIDVEDGGLINLTGNNGNGIFHVAHGFGSDAEVTVNGTGSTITAASSLVVGQNSRARVNVEGGGAIDARSISIGNSNGAHTDVAVNVTGKDSLLRSNNSITVANGSSATLTVSNGAVVEAATGNLSFKGNGSSYEANINFGIGDDGTGNIASGMMKGGLLDLADFGGTSIFDLLVDESVSSLTVGHVFTLIDYDSWDSDLFSYFDYAGMKHILDDGSLFSVGDYQFLIDYDDEIAMGDFAFTATVVASPVPVPAAFWLFASGLLGMICLARRVD